MRANFRNTAPANSSQLPEPKGRSKKLSLLSACYVSPATSTCGESGFGRQRLARRAKGRRLTCVSSAWRLLGGRAARSASTLVKVSGLRTPDGSFGHEDRFARKGAE